MEEDQIVAIWDLFLDFIPEKSRELAASQYVDFLLTHVDIETLDDLHGCDEYLDTAIEEAREENDRFDDEEDDYWNEDAD